MVFAEFNMTLPSSASVECLFGVGGQIETPIETSYQTATLKILLLLKANEWTEIWHFKKSFHYITFNDWKQFEVDCITTYTTLSVSQKPGTYASELSQMRTNF